MKLVEIAQGWLNLAKDDPILKEMAERRLDICDGCPFKKQLSGTGQAIIQVVNQEGSIYYCDRCGCPLATKTLAPDAVCPAGNWGPEVLGYY